MSKYVTEILVVCTVAVCATIQPGCGADEWQEIGAAQPTLQKQAAPQEPSWEQNLSHGESLFKSGNLAEAGKYFQAAVVQAQKFGPHDPRLATALNNVALVLKKQGKIQDAERLFRNALDIDQKTFGNAHANVSRDCMNLAMLYSDTNKFSEAEQMFKRALAIDEQMGGPDHPFVALDLESYASMLKKCKRAPEAEALEKRAKEIQTKVVLASSAATWEKLIETGDQYFRAGNFAGAEQAFMAAGSEAQVLGHKEGKIASTLIRLAAIYERQGQYAKGEQFAQNALDLDMKFLGAVNPAVVRDLNNLALLYDRQNKNDESERVHKLALEMNQKIFGPDHPTMIVALQNYASLLHKLNRNDEASALEKKAKQLTFKQRVLPRFN